MSVYDATRPWDRLPAKRRPSESGFKQERPLDLDFDVLRFDSPRERDLKRLKPTLNGLVEIPLDCHPEGVSTIYFVRGTYGQYVRGYQGRESELPPGVREEFVDDPSVRHEDGSRMSVCARYIQWLYPKQSMSRAQLRARRRFIRLYREGDVLYFFKADGVVPDWETVDGMHDNVMSYLEPKERVLFEGAVSRGVRMRAADRAPTLCREIKFVIPESNQDDEWRQFQAGMINLLNNLTRTGPLPRCPTGVDQIVFECGPGQAQKLVNLFFNDRVVNALSGATQKIMVQGQVTLYQRYVIADRLQKGYYKGHLHVDRLYVTLDNWRFHAWRVAPADVSLSAGRTIFVIEEGDEIDVPEYNDLLADLQSKSNDVFQELRNGFNFEFLLEANNPKKFVTDSTTWDQSQEQERSARDVLAGAKHIRDKDEWWSGYGPKDVEDVD